MTGYICSIFLCCKKFKHETKYEVTPKNQKYESNRESYIFTILHLPFEMVCYIFQKRIPFLRNNYKSQFLIVWLVSLLLHFLSFEEGKNKRHASNNYKYWVKIPIIWSHKHNTKCYIYHLLCFVTIIFTTSSPPTISKQPNKDDKTEMLFDERSTINLCQLHTLRTSNNSKTGWLP